VFEYEPLLDSANMSVDDYIRLAKDIQDNYAQYDGFVILHGTDTMAYTASALSFMLENLGKPVILTGSQVSVVAKHHVSWIYCVVIGLLSVHVSVS
jgi:L-asparaginase/Glu-tRNA(Gln) amidotransferase subunit D